MHSKLDTIRFDHKPDVPLAALPYPALTMIRTLLVQAPSSSLSSSAAGEEVVSMLMLLLLLLLLLLSIFLYSSV
jgi:hypothetical protein